MRNFQCNIVGVPVEGWLHPFPTQETYVPPEWWYQDLLHNATVNNNVPAAGNWHDDGTIDNNMTPAGDTTGAVTPWRVWEIELFLYMLPSDATP